MSGFIPWLVQQARLNAATKRLRGLNELEDLQQQNALLPGQQTSQDVEWIRQRPVNQAGEREAAYLSVTQDPVAAQQAMALHARTGALRQAQQGLAGNPYALGALGSGQAPKPPYEMNSAGIWDQYTGEYAESTPALSEGQERMASAGYNLARAGMTLSKPMVAKVGGKDVYVRQVAPGVYETVTDTGGAALEATKLSAPQSTYTKPTHPVNTCAADARAAGMTRDDAGYGDFMTQCVADQEQMLSDFGAPEEASPADALMDPRGRRGGPPPGAAGAGGGAAPPDTAQVAAWIQEQLAAGIPEDLVRQVLEEMGVAWPAP